MKILFLDVDGVLNRQSLLTADAATFVLCPKACARLKVLIKKTGAKVVLSSSWRLSEPHVAFLREHGVMDEVHEDWCTKEFSGKCMRGFEIDEWLSRHPEVKRYAIVDDYDGILPKQRRYFIRTSFVLGLQDRHVTRLVAILGENGGH